MAIKKLEKDLQYYMNLPWTYRVKANKDTNGNVIYVAYVMELPQIVTKASTVDKATQQIKLNMKQIFQTMIEDGDEIPEPGTSDLDKKAQYYVNLPWTYTVETDKDHNGDLMYIVHVAEFPGVATDAPTREEVMILIKEPLFTVIRWMLEDGEAIPEPGMIPHETFEESDKHEIDGNIEKARFA